MKAKRAYFSVLIIFFIFAVVIALSTGSQNIAFWHIFDGSLNKHQELILSLRVPRILNAITVGALLSLAGLMVQNLLKNPLADPYILGLSGAAATVQLAIIASGLVLPHWLFMLCGFIGAILSLILLLVVTSSHVVHRTSQLLLSGVVIAFAYGAIISLILTLSPESATKPMLFWLMGDLSFAQFSVLPLILLLAVLLVAVKFHKELDILARGELFALKSGIDVKKFNLMLLTTASIFTAIAVSMAGTIGFIGLVVPHMCRLLAGHQHLKLIPLCAIVGALILLVADTLARTVVAPIQLPVGIFTALFGVPIFLLLMRTGHQP